MTVKKYIGADERYPEYLLRDPGEEVPGDAEIEMSDDDWADYQRVCAEYEAWQERLEAAIPPAKPEEIKAGREWHERQEREQEEAQRRRWKAEEGG